jgi:hypothetical protein
MGPAVGVGLLRLIHVWSNDMPLTDFNGSAVAVAIATAIVGLIAYWLTHFSFLFVAVVTAILVTAQFLALAGDSTATGDDRATAALVAGGLVVIVGVFLDAFGRRRDAFWFHALGWFSVAAGLLRRSSPLHDHGPEREALDIRASPARGGARQLRRRHRASPLRGNLGRDIRAAAAARRHSSLSL